MKTNRQSTITALFGRYPLTFYFGLLLVVGGGLIFWLHWQLHWQFNWNQLWFWLNRHAPEWLAALTVLLGLILLGSAVAYKKTVHLAEDEYYLWLEQRSTRTLFPFFTPLHDWLRLRIAIYRWWHTRPFAGSVHVIILVLAVLAIFGSVRRTLADDGLVVQCESHTITTTETWSGTVCFGDITVSGNGVLTIAGGTVATLQSLTVGAADLSSKGMVIIEGDTLNNVGAVLNVSNNVSVYGSSEITGNANGFAGGTKSILTGSGPGGGGSAGTAPDVFAAGGSYGGVGGTNGGAMAGATYGSANAPTQLGSGGGFADNSGTLVAGGAGAAALKIIAGGVVTVNGSVGMNGASTSGSGGSGGSIWLEANHCAGSGTISANGGNGSLNGSGGGGGRVFRRCNYLDSPDVTPTATHGNGGSGAGDGTVVLSRPAVGLAVTDNFSSQITAGEQGKITVRALNGSGATATDYTGTVHFSASSLQADLPSDYIFQAGDAGLKVFVMTLKRAGTITLTGADTQTTTISGSEKITVSAATASQFVIVTAGSAVAGLALTPAVTVEDRFGNVVVDYNHTIHFTSSDAQAVVPVDYEFRSTDAGVKAFAGQLTFKTAGSQTLIVGELGGQATGGLKLSVSAGAASALNAIAPATAVAGSSITIQLRARDAYGNTATSYRGTVAFSSSDLAAGLPAVAIFSSTDTGSKKIAGFNLKTAGSQTIAFQDSQIAALATTAVITVNASTITRYLITATSPERTTIGWSETISAEDQFGNPANNVAATTLTLENSGQAKFYADSRYQTPIGRVVFSGGQLKLYLRDEAAETITISLTDGAGVSGHSASIIVNPATVCIFGLCLKIDSPAGGAVSTLNQSSQAVRSYFRGRPSLNQATAVVSAGAGLTAFLGFGPIGTLLASAFAAGAAQGSSALYLLFAGILPLQARRRPKWGTVRQAITGLPIAGVFVELLNGHGQPLGRNLTDKTGRYGFLVSQPGAYQIRITNPLYGTYLSPLVTVTNPRVQLVMDDIVLLPIASRLSARLAEALSWVKIAKWLGYLYWPTLLLGSALAGILLFEQLSVGRLVLALIYLLFWVAKLFQLRLDRPFGVVSDRRTGRPLSYAVVQLTQAGNDHAIVHSTITDEHGRFLFTVRPAEYQLIVTKAGYQNAQASLSGDRLNKQISLEPQLI
ncbi:MAG TPA: carboxypeptidase regulatory-like domain-containing protein [Candidatus Saccharimonadales bacterium]|nr:carboxypeptidase regulatory-like domain-containing protein [Candidatus Saccharimonadales bacterium]